METTTTAAPPAELREACLPPYQQLVDGSVFPKVFCPSSPDSPPDSTALAEIFRKNKLFLEQQLDEHRGLLFRGFPLRSAADFNALVEATGWEGLTYVGGAPRTKILDGVYTANDMDPNAIIPFHHELALLKEGWPAKILFFCELDAAEGGQTPILVSHKITEKMEKAFPEFMRKLEDLGLLHIKVLPLNTDPSKASCVGWPLAFGTSDRLEAEKRVAATFGARVKWLPDDSLQMISGPFKATRRFDRPGRSETAWFNNILIYFSEAASTTEVTSDQPYAVLFGDGSALPADAVEACRKFHEEISVAIPWHAGDLMILDNLAVMHGRRAYKPPRRVLVALCK